MSHEDELLEELDADIRELAKNWARGDYDHWEDLAQEARLGIIQEYRERPDSPRHHLFRRAKHEILDYRKKGKSVDGKLDRKYKREFVWGLVSLDTTDLRYVLSQATSPFYRSWQRKPVEDEAVTNLAYGELEPRLSKEESNYVSLKLQGYTRSQVREALGLTPYQERQLLYSLQVKADEVFCLNGCDGAQRR